MHYLQLFNILRENITHILNDSGLSNSMTLLLVSAGRSVETVRRRFSKTPRTRPKAEIQP